MWKWEEYSIFIVKINTMLCWCTVMWTGGILFYNARGWLKKKNTLLHLDYCIFIGIRRTTQKNFKCTPSTVQYELQEKFHYDTWYHLIRKSICTKPWAVFHTDAQWIWWSVCKYMLVVCLMHCGCYPLLPASLCIFTEQPSICFCWRIIISL